ncbi:MAG: 5-dehydro-4-deoxy-D-glucuronate isomerase [Bacteroidales bacterium]|nr:5-dehydro-4-deoxy-D-glucuronate isomerase [Bacteroidales bacterium]
MKYEVRYAHHPEDFKQYDTRKIRQEFLFANIMEPGNINLVYSHYDRFIVGGAVPLKGGLELETIDPLRAEFFLERREIGIINVGGKGQVDVDGDVIDMEKKEGLYIGRGNKKVIFKSVDSADPAHFYLNSATAHKTFPVKKVGLADAEVAELGSLESSNARKINKLLVNGVIETCQVQMGITDLQTGSVWNTMPPHVHSRRMEAYFYFDLPKDQVICHFLGEPDETRHIWLKNEEAVISGPWSIHSAAGTFNYSFIWGMAGENLDYGDMDWANPADLQ